MYGSEFWIELALKNFSLAMLLVAIVFILMHKLIRRSTSKYEIIYRWIALFPVGITGIYAFVMHAFFPDIAASSIGWAMSPFQYEVAMANLGFGVIAILSFSASYGFRLATVIGTVFWLWGDATGHIYQMIVNQNFSVGNAGSWFWMDVLLPFILIICIIRLRPGMLMVIPNEKITVTPTLR